MKAGEIPGKKTVGLVTRLATHAAGRRSGDQFCVYVADRVILSQLSREEVEQIASGRHSMDPWIRRYIHREVGFRFVTTPDAISARTLEQQARSGALGSKPIFNPLP
jgi:hypothetical protein